MPDEPSEPILDPEEDEGGPVKSFLEHLEDLRWVLIKVISSVLVAMVVCMAGTPFVIKVLTWPKNRSMEGKLVELTWLTPLGPFTTQMKIAFWGGIVFAVPYILFVIAQFVMPALKKNEKPYFHKAFLIGGGLFFAGVAVAYIWIIPLAVTGMIEIAAWMGPKITQWQADEYFQFVVMLMLGMGLSFEIPVIVLTLVRMGIIPHEWMAKGRSYFFVANLVICAFITPDAFSTIFMVLPVQILLEVCIQISAHWERQKKKLEAAQRELENRPE